MRVLLDHCVHRKFGRLLIGHDVSTARQMRWDALRNGLLVAAAEQGGFDVLVTTDKSLRYQQNLSGRNLSIITLDVLFTILPSISPLAPAVLEALESLTPGAFLVIGPEPSA